MRHLEPTARPGLPPPILEAGAARRILLIDDDVELANMLREYLEPDHYRVTLAATGAEAAGLLAREIYDLLVLDLMLPDTSGLDILRRYRAHTRAPVIMLSAHSGESDRVLGLELGADDYLTKPFGPRELKARIAAVLRRLTTAEQATLAPAELSVGPLSLDPATGIAQLASRQIPLTGAEHRVLEILMRSAGRIVPRAEMSQFALGRPHEPSDRSLDTHISSLRRKLGLDDESTLIIRNLRGRGYSLVAATSA